MPIMPGSPIAIIIGSIPGGPSNLQSFCDGIPSALLMLPCTMSELAEVWLRSATSSLRMAPSFSNVPAEADWFTLSC